MKRLLSPAEQKLLSKAISQYSELPAASSEIRAAFHCSALSATRIYEALAQKLGVRPNAPEKVSKGEAALALENANLRQTILKLRRQDGKSLCAKLNPSRSSTWLFLPDIHFPLIHVPTWDAALAFLSANKVDGVVLGGDQLDNACISHHNVKKPLYKPAGSYKADEEGFRQEVLEPLERILPRTAQRVWIVGNHDDWERQLIESHPEFEGLVDRVTSLELEKNDWTVVSLGEAYKLGKLNVIHGEVLSGVSGGTGQYAAKRAVELYGGSVLCGHTHSPQMFSKVSPVQETNKWQAYISPILGSTNPAYMIGKPSAWVNGFTIVEVQPSGNFNCYLINVIDGTFSYGGKTYGRGRVSRRVRRRPRHRPGTENGQSWKEKTNSKKWPVASVSFRKHTC